LRKIALAVFLAAVVLSDVGCGTEANATNVCGMNGCAPVLVKRVRVPPRKIVTTAGAPLVVSATPAPAAATPSLLSLPPLPSLPSLSAAPWPLSLLGK
jgi:hypothetical protein